MEEWENSVRNWPMTWLVHVGSITWIHPGPQATGKSEASGSKGSTDRTAVFTSWHGMWTNKEKHTREILQVEDVVRKFAPTLTVPVPYFLCKIHTASFICGAYSIEQNNFRSMHLMWGLARCDSPR